MEVVSSTSVIAKGWSDVGSYIADLSMSSLKSQSSQVVSLPDWASNRGTENRASYDVAPAEEEEEGSKKTPLQVRDHIWDKGHHERGWLTWWVSALPPAGYHQPPVCPCQAALSLSYWRR